MVERRRVEYDEKIDNIYVTMRKEDNIILSEIKKSREDSGANHKKLDEKIASIEKMIWMACGGGTVIGFLISLAVNYLKVAR